MMCIIKKKYVCFIVKEKKEDKMNILKKFVNYVYFYVKYIIFF